MSDTRMNALIVGGTQGLGLAIARELARDGWSSVVVTGRTRETGQRAVAELEALGIGAHFVAGDLSDAADCIRMVDEAATLAGPLSGLVNSAANCDRGGLLDTTPEVWARLMDTNARGPFFTMQAFARHAVAEGRPASIVNISSVSGYCGQFFLTPYSASKGALNVLTKNVANAMRGNRIRCNAIACGWMDTPGEDATQKKWHAAPDDWLAQAEAKLPFGQLVKPEQVAPLAAFLLSPRSGVMTGAIIDCDQNVVGSFPE